MIGKETRWLQRLDFHSCTDEADKNENVLSQMGHNRLMSK